MGESFQMQMTQRVIPWHWPPSHASTSPILRILINYGLQCWKAFFATVDCDSPYFKLHFSSMKLRTCHVQHTTLQFIAIAWSDLNTDFSFASVI